MPTSRSAQQPLTAAGQRSTLTGITANYDDIVLADKPRAFYRLNDTGQQLLDSVTGDVAGTYGDGVGHGGPPLTSDGGATSIFPGGDLSQSNVALATPATRLQAKSISVELWFSESAFEPGDLTLAGYGESSSHPYVLYVADGDESLGFGVRAQGGSTTAWGPRMQQGQQYHVVGTYDSTTGKLVLYLNGHAVAWGHTSGALTYSTTGFSIGGAVKSGYAALEGFMGDVAVYPYALSPKQIQEHYLAGVDVPLQSEKPAMAQALVDSIGVNTHFDASPYIEHTQKVINLLEASGIRHIREGMDPNEISVYNQLAAAGVRGQYLTEPTMSDATIETWPGKVPASFEAYEGPNEPQFNDGPHWDVITRKFMQRLAQDVRDTPGLSGYPIVGPSCPETARLGDLGPFVTYGNMHPYFGEVYNPGTAGWGPNSYGSLPYNVNNALEVTPDKPIDATETGYDSGPRSGPDHLDDVTAGKYIARTYFYFFNFGVPRTFVYEFLDQNRTNQEFTRSGLVDLDLNPKPAYNAVHAIIADLTDSGQTVNVTPLAYRLTGNLDNVDHTLLQKSNGAYYLALWLEVPSWSSGHDFDARPQAVTITTQAPVQSANIMTLDDAGNPTFTQLGGMPSTNVPVEVSDRISIIELTL